MASSVSDSEGEETVVSASPDESLCYNYTRTNKLLYASPDNTTLQDFVEFDHRNKRRIEHIYLRPSEDDLRYRSRERLFIDSPWGQEIPALKRYRKQRDTDRRTGEIPQEYNKFWEIWEKDSEGLEDFSKVRLLRPLEKARIHTWTEDQEEIPKEDLKKVEIHLTPADEDRYHQVGRVFFDRVISYHPTTTVHSPKLKLKPVEHYTVLPITGDYYYIDPSEYRRERADIYEPKVGSGILKRLTVAAQQKKFWEERIKYIISTQENPQYPEQHQEVLHNLYRELSNNSNNFENWFLTTDSLIQSQQDIARENRRKFCYYLDNKYRNLINFSVRHQRRRAENLQRVLRKLYYARILQGFGTTYTILPTQE